MPKAIRFWTIIRILLGLGATVLWNCNVSNNGDIYVLNVNLSDSLATERGTFKTVVIDIYDGNGNLIQADVFHGTYHLSDSATLANLVLSKKPPDPFEIRITAYKDSNDFWVFETKIANGNSLTVSPSHHAVSPNITDTTGTNGVKGVKVVAIDLSAKKLNLFSGGPTATLTVAITGNDSGAHFKLSSSNSLVASVDSDGLVKGLSAGQTAITATVVGYPAVTSVCSVTVVTDPPVPTITPDQTIAYGAEAVFKVSVTQANGTISEIKADLDGDGILEQTILNKDTATFKAVYSQVKTFNLSFQIRDTEGNSVDVQRKVTVLPPAAPVVKITDPATDITLNAITYTVKFTVMDATKAIDESKDSSVTLHDGANTIKVSRENPGGTGSAQVVITVDRTAPGVPVFVAQSALTSDNTPTWKWGAVTGAALYQVRLDDSDFTKASGTTNVTELSYTSGVLFDGLHTLYIRSVDGLGNASMATFQKVTVKTALPVMAILVSAPSIASSVKSPEWKWKSGDVSKGNGTFEVWLNDVQQPNVETPSYKATNLSDGKYVLKVKELDALGQESAAYLIFPEMTIDGIKPTITASYVDGSVTVLSTTAKATITGTITDGPKGSGIQSATYSLSGKTTKVETAITNPAAFSLNSIALSLGGVTTLTITATDVAGNAQTYVMDFNVTLKAPVVKIISPTPRDGYISNSTGAITVYYTVDDVPAQPVIVPIAEPADGSSSTEVVYTASSTNDAGTGTDARTFYRAHRDVRFFKVGGTAVASCADWENACAFYDDLSKHSGKTLWVAAGEYDITSTVLTLANVKIYGGLPTNAVNTLATTGSYSHIFTNVNPGTSLQGFSISGPNLEWNHISVSGNYGGGPPLQILDIQGATFNGCKFYDFRLTTPYYGVGFAIKSKTIFNQCIFDNSIGEGPMIYYSADPGVYLSFTNCDFTSSTQSPGPYFDIESPASPDSYPTLQNSYRFYSLKGATPYLRPNEMACGLGLPGMNTCP